MNAEFSQLLQLPAPQKLELVEALWDSLENTLDDLPVPDWQKQELDRRKAAHEKDPSSALTWPDAKARIIADRG